MVQVAIGDTTTCALEGATGAVYCWGDGGSGQLGDGSTTATQKTPVQVKGVGGTGTLSGIAQITAGMSHFCGVATTGAVYCWGTGGSGQLGNGATAATQSTPVQVKGVGGTGTLSGITQVTAGYYSTCGLVGATGAVYCWGGSSKGQLGRGSTTPSSTPVQVKGVGGSGTLSGITQITSGQQHFCAFNGTSDTAYCWGFNFYGQMGIGNTVDIQKTPVQVIDLP
jgi:alpha-tubulin suppressor-like RCC1 family protein